MKKETQISKEFYDQTTVNPAGYRDKRGEWRPAKPISYAPVFVWPAQLKKFGSWLFDYLFKWNLFFFAITLVTWLYFQPDLETCRTFQPGWIAQMFIRNMILLWLIYGGWHLYLYTFKKRGHQGKYSPRWQSEGGGTFLFKNQVQDNIFWTCGSGCITWTAYEVVTMWMYANGHLPYLDPKESPVLFAAVLLAIPFWREFHFYWIHRLIHWKPLYDRIHYLHHYNINPGPWSGMAMHPVEHLLYFSVTLIHWIIPSHPIHFLFNAQHTALTPAAGHTGFEGKLTEQISFGSHFHYLHHRYFDCNYGESSIPLDKWFGSFDNGAWTDAEKAEARRPYHVYMVDHVVDESHGVKSFHLKRADGSPLESYAPGQHLMFKIPVGENGQTALRFYTLSDYGNQDHYRISVKRENAPSDRPDVPPGRVSNWLHDHLRAGDQIEARGPLGDFVPRLESRKPMVLIAGGIGITPVLAMAKACLQKRPGRQIHLFLSFRDPAQQVFKEEVQVLLRTGRRIECYTHFTGSRDVVATAEPRVFSGRLSIVQLKTALPDLNRDFYICGPGGMMKDMMDGLVSAGVPADLIHTESFNQGRQQESAFTASSEEHEVTFARSDKTLAWDSEYRNLLEFGESNGIRMEAGCMFGECGACAAKILKGDVVYNYKTATTPKPGYCLPCSCRPGSTLSIEA
jgi:ferredoxin-NADP reductase/sterol desaturase/sphingolipid hydroxylase (fatty acid hydroxylase superfamily)